MADRPEVKKVIDPIKSNAAMTENKLKANLNKAKADLSTKVDDNKEIIDY